MRITEVSLRNIKSYQAATISFPLGTIAISGPNGAGKSTILEAIGFALFDFLPYRNQREFMRHNALEADVRVTFLSRLDECPYQAVRTLKRATGTDSVTSSYYVYSLDAGGRVAQQKQEVQDFLRSHIGLDDYADLGRVFDNVLGVPQGRLTADFLLTPAQRKVLARLDAALGDGGGTFLLHGVTGSGKTLVYIELIRRVLGRGGGAVVLVPEIALTPQTVARFRQAFGDSVAVLHSGLSDGERFDAWRQLRSGARRIAVGARSAVFAPVSALGAIVVDEEHDGSYKQSESPRYNARDVAVVRARRAGAVCVLGSATPSLESWMNAGSEKYGLLELPDRVGGGVLPDVRVVDLKLPPKEGAVADPAPAESDDTGPPAPPLRILSPLLADAVRQRLSRREQTILLLNRRGYATFALCENCGAVGECVDCSVSLTLHRARRRMICHHCGYVESPPTRCPRCGSREMTYGGLGTEQVERVLVESFPGGRVARMDMDTTRGKWSHRDILERVRSGEVDTNYG